MLLLTETTLFHWDLAFEFLSHRLSNTKGDFSGPHTLKNVQQWASKVQTTGRPPQTGGGPASSHSYVTSSVNTNFTTASEIFQYRGTPITSSNDGLGYDASVESGDGPYRDALMDLPNVSDSSRSVWCRLFTQSVQPGHC